MKMKRANKLLGFVVAGSLCLMPGQKGKALEVSTDIRSDLVSICNLYSRTNSTSLTIRGKTATIVGVVKGITGTTTKIHAKMTLQKYSGKSWSTVKVYEKTVTTTNYTFSKTTSVTSGKYRVKGVYTIYKGAKSEKTTQYSSVVSC